MNKISEAGAVGLAAYFLSGIFLGTAVRPRFFLPEWLYSFLFSEISVLGSAPTYFWIGAGLFSLIVLGAGVDVLYDVFKALKKRKRLGVWITEGEEYLERHGVKRVKD